MNPVIRALAIYFFLLIVFRLAGKRSLSQVTTFDFVLLLIISEATQQGLIGDDYSLTNAFVLIATLVGTDLALSIVKARFPRTGPWLDDVPLVLVENGRPLRERMRRMRVDEEDILHAARQLQGLERLEQVRYAVLERSGGITVIPAGRQ